MSDAAGRGRMVRGTRRCRRASAPGSGAAGSGAGRATRTITANRPGRMVEIRPSADTVKMLKPQVRSSRFQYCPYSGR